MWASMKIRVRLLIAIAILATAGVVVSSVSLYHHFAASKTAYCDIGESFNCDIVNRSIYSTVLGVPVAAIGIAGYFGLFSLATFHRERNETAMLLITASMVGLAFALYLTYIEGFVLATWCILCLSSLFLIFAITVLSSVLALNAARNNRALS
jgi:vitamin-K-epoxide reductase (warfarin-sensitive)